MGTFAQGMQGCCEERGKRKEEEAGFCLLTSGYRLRI